MNTVLNFICAIEGLLASPRGNTPLDLADDVATDRSAA